MGNIKYPLNGRHLTLGDLVSEFGYISNEIQKDNENNELLNTVQNQLHTQKTWKNTYENNIPVLDTDGMITDFLKSDAKIDKNVLYNTWYQNFSNHIYGGIGMDTFAKSPYEICYFPTVISDKERSKDNKSYKTIQKGDDALYSPDRYIKFKDVIISNGGDDALSYRIMPLFHYVYVGNNSENDNTKTFRFSFNYKLSNGLATSIHALKQMYELLDKSDVSLFKGQYLSSRDVGSGFNTDTFAAFSSVTTPADIIDILLFGKVDGNPQIISYGNNDGYCLLYDIAPFKKQIRVYLQTSYDVQPDAYKILQNYEIRGGKNHDNKFEFNNDSYKISCSSDTNKLTWNDILAYAIFGSDQLADPKLHDLSVNNDNISYKTYYEFDKQNNQDRIITESDKQINLYYKLLYYSTILVNCQLYYTGIIIHAVYDVINPLHKYTTEDPLYRCDVGANTDIIEVIYNNSTIITEYGLTTRSIPDTATVTVIIPISVITQISSKDIDVRYTWTISEIKKMLRNGVNVYNYLKDDSTEETSFVPLDINTLKTKASSIKYDYMILSHDSKTLYMSNSFPKTDEIILNINTSLFTQTSYTYIYGQVPSPTISSEQAELVNNIDSSLNIYNANTNPAINTAAFDAQPQIQDVDAGKVSQFYGTLYARIQYNKHPFIVQIPIMRLQNYYYEQSKGNNRSIYLFFEDIKNIGQMSNFNQYPIVRYAVEESKNIINIDLSRKESALYMAYNSQQGVYTKYISGVSKTEESGQSNAFYRGTVLINDTSTKNVEKFNCYCLSDKAESAESEYNIIINPDNDVDRLYVNILYVDADQTNEIKIYNKTDDDIACLYRSYRLNDDIVKIQDVNYSGYIKSQQVGSVYYNTTASAIQNTSRELHVYYDKSYDPDKHMVPTNSMSYYIIGIDTKITSTHASFIPVGSLSLKNIYIYKTPVYKYVINKLGDIENNIIFKYTDSVVPEVYMTDKTKLYTTKDFSLEDINNLKNYIDTDLSDYTIILNAKTVGTNDIPEYTVNISKKTETPPDPSIGDSSITE